MFKKIIRISMIFVMGLILCCGCSQNKSSDDLKDGAYFLTKANDSIVKDEYDFYWVAILGDTMTISEIGNKNVYSISKEGSSYVGKSHNKQINLRLNNDILTLDFAKKDQFKYKKYNEHTYSDEVEKLESPLEVRDRIGRQKNYVVFEWVYMSSYGSIGAKAEIKKANSNSYEFLKKDSPYMNSLVIQVFSDNLSIGDNFVRFCSVGGPMITKDKKLFLQNDSDYVEYKITMDEQGLIKNVVKV